MGETDEPWRQRRQRRGADRERAVPVEQERRQAPQHGGRPYRANRIVGDRAGIAVGGARSRLVGLDQDNLAPLAGEPDRDGEADDAGADDRDLGRPALAHRRSSDAGVDMAMAIGQDVAEDLDGFASDPRETSPHPARAARLGAAIALVRRASPECVSARWPVTHSGGPAATRSRQLGASMRGGALAGAELTLAVKTLAQQGLPGPKLLLLLLDDPLDDAILDHASANQGAERRDAPAIDAQHRRDVADEGTGGDDKAQAKTGCDALGEAGDMDAPTSAPRACQ